MRRQTDGTPLPDRKSEPQWNGACPHCLGLLGRTMVDDLNERSTRDAPRINIANERDLRAWAKLFRVTAEHLVRAVAAVGTRADQVEAHLFKDTQPLMRNLPQEDPHER